MVIIPNFELEMLTLDRSNVHMQLWCFEQTRQRWVKGMKCHAR
jgi:hypothetical protein